MRLVIEALESQLDASGRWMAWNLTLALAPWLVSIFLFRREVLSRTLGGFSRPLPLMAMAGTFGTLSIGLLLTRPVLQAVSLRTAPWRGDAP